MRTIWGNIVGVMVALILSYQVQANDALTLISTGTDYHLYSANSGTIVLLEPQGRGLYTEYQPKGTKASRIHTGNCVVINGFYFGKGQGEDLFQPAGPIVRYRSLRSIEVIASTTNPHLDANLQHTVFYSMTNNNISFDKSLRLASGVAFFAGPLLISDGTINPKLTSRISHWNAKHYRTFIIQRANKQAVRGYTPAKMTLHNLATELRELYPDETISVINLDGGSSTSFASPTLSFNANKTLPLFFHTCKKTSPDLIEVSDSEVNG